MTFQFPVRFLAGMTHRLLPVVILALLSLRLSAANVSFVVTNQMTGQPDTNAISVQALNPNANADGSYNSIGLPVWVLPPYVWTNMYQGTWLASNSFICQAYNGPGVIGSSQGIIFAVDNTTNSYSFLRYPVSGYNVMNWFTGLVNIVGTNGFTVGVTNGIAYLDGSAFTPVLSSNGIVTALTFVPASLLQATNASLSGILAQGLASTNFTLSTSNSLAQLIAITTNGVTLPTVTNIIQSLVSASNNVTLGNIASTNTANLVITTNLVNAASNSLSGILLGTINTASNAAVSAAGVNLGAGTNAVLAQIYNSSNAIAANAQFALSASNLVYQAQMLASNVLQMNALVNASNGLAASTASLSNLVAANQQYSIGVSNNDRSTLGLAVVASNNAVNANFHSIGVSNLWIAGSNNLAASILTSSNGAVGAAVAGVPPVIANASNNIMAQLVLTNNSLVAQINNASNQNAGYSLNLSNILGAAIVGSNNAANLYTLGVSNRDRKSVV